MAARRISSKVNVQIKKQEESDENYLRQRGYSLDKTLAKGLGYVVKHGIFMRRNLAVAIKIVDLNQVPFPYLNRIISTEIKALQECQHKYVVKLLAYYETVNRLYLITEFALHGTLASHLADLHSKRLRENVAQKWFAQLLEALAHCHSQGWAHCNVTMNQILINEDRTIRLAGFNYATPLSTNVQNPASFEPNPYAAPETMTGEPYDAQKTDVWSAGIVLYRMLFGQYPYEIKDKSRQQILQNALKPIVFPQKKAVSMKVIQLLNKILTSVEERLNIRDIQKSDWMAAGYAKKNR